MGDSILLESSCRIWQEEKQERLRPHSSFPRRPLALDKLCGFRPLWHRKNDGARVIFDASSLHFPPVSPNHEPLESIAHECDDLPRSYLFSNVEGKEPLSNKLFGLSSGDLAVGVIGILLTLALLSGYRPFQGDLAALNLAFLSGPILLVALAASRASRPKAQPKKPSAVKTVTGVGILLLLIGGCPWTYTPYLVNGKADSASGMIGTIIFLMIGVPGVIITLVGLVNMRSTGGSETPRR